MPSTQAVTLIRTLSRLLGWIYTTSWSLSFYPQPILNWRRRATTGTTIDFPVINILGFVFYLISTTLLFTSSTIRAQYAARHPDSPEPTARGNDVAFAAHAVLLSVITTSMFWGRLWGFKQKKGQRPSRAVIGIGLGCLAGVGWVVALVRKRGVEDPNEWAWIDVVYAMGYAKLVITICKYIPQVIANYRRKSTVGWSIGQILCDVVGGVLSIAQLLIDAGLQGDWSGVTGNPVKFGLGNISILFDIVFMTQHYYLYPHKEDEGERRGLLAPDSGDD